MAYADIADALKRRRLLIAVAVLIAAIVGTSRIYSLDGTHLEQKGSSYGFATTSLLVDSARSPLVDLRQDTGVLSERAALYSTLFRSQPVQAAIADAAGLPPAALVVLGGASSQLPSGDARGPFADEDYVYTGGQFLRFGNVGGQPLINVQVVAADAASAGRLADAAVQGTRRYVAEQQRSDAVPPDARVQLRRLGDPQASPVVERPSRQNAVIAFMAVLLGLVFLIVVLDLLTREPAAPTGQSVRQRIAA
jgi:hypothetical protein